MQCPVCNSTVPDTAQTCPICGNPLGSQTLLPGSVLNGKYRIDSVLGQGGFGITYAATQTLLGSRVAIKEMFPTGTLRQGNTVRPTTLSGLEWNQTKKSFIEEAQVLARFNHPDIVRVMDLFEEGGTAYIVMERLSGETLQERLQRQGALPPAEVQAIALRVAQALQLVHDGHLLHRDIKPDNIFLESSGRVVLIDFGSARAFESGKTMQHTRMVTPGYAPMEQYGSAMKFGPYTDIYALGATLYHALSGHMPPPAPDLLQGTPLPPLPARTPDSLKRAVQWAMQPKIADRPQNVAELLTVLGQGQAGPVPATPTPPSPVPPRPQPAPRPQPQPVPTPSPAPTPRPTVARRKPSVWPMVVLGLLAFGGYRQLFGTEKTAAAHAATEASSTDSTGTDTGTTDQSAQTDTTSTDSTSTDTSNTDSATTQNDASAQSTPDIPQAPSSSSTSDSQTAETDAAATAAPLMITDPAPYATLPPGGFDLKGSGQPGDVVDISEDETRLGRIQIGDDGGWQFSVPGPSAGPHTYKVSNSDGTLLSSVSVNIARPEATVPPAEQISDEEVNTLVDEYMSDGAADDVGPAMDLYAEQVDYFTRGMQPRSALYTDKSNYFKRWPQRSYQRTTPVTTLSSQGNTRQVRFDYHYDITNSAKEVSGTAYTVLDLVKQDGKLLITGEKGAIYPETQVKRVLTPEGQDTSAQTPTAPATGAAPKFAAWHFGSCRDEESGLLHPTLSRGRLQDCPLVIETVPNGAHPVSAVFNYELEYPDEYGTTQKFAIDAPDHWPPAPDQPTTVFRQDGSNLIFILPLIVKDRPDRQYNSINVTGTITFSNGSRKNVYEKLAVQ